MYVHIPFCVRKCYYCDFAAGPAPEAIRQQYVDRLVDEIRGHAWRGAAARTLYFGGGTPSELSTPQLARITEAARETFRFSEGAEWSIECNPGTVSVESFTAIREMGFNRVSLGLQTFHDAHLKALGRIHTAAESVEAIEAAQQAGIPRLSLDLIFCLPGQTLEEWRSDVERALSFGAEHLSLYNLTIEQQTEFGRRYRAGLLALPDEDLSADMYEWVIDRLTSHGFEQYEVSNFARPGAECRHNQTYWRGEPFLGLGLGAASYAEGLRWGNTRSMQRYLATACRPQGPERAWEERLEVREALGEAMMVGLRTREGISVGELSRRFGLDVEALHGAVLRECREDGLLEPYGDRLRLTRRGIMLANAVCERFL
ncbi:MAG: radical SAM family heme chaperone HemW [Armatimonadota bacterium]